MTQPEKHCPKHADTQMTKCGMAHTVFFINGETAPGWDYVCPKCTEEDGNGATRSYLMLPVEAWPK